MPFEDLGDGIYLPKVGGEPLTVKIVNIEKVQVDIGDDVKYNFKSLKKVFNYHYLLTCADGRKIRLGTWKLFFAMKEAGVKEEDIVEISHPSTGVWKVTRI